jgi:endonuclease/exonuclease/phosphatase family metal-dependent hydrolase
MIRKTAAVYARFFYASCLCAVFVFVLSACFAFAGCALNVSSRSESDSQNTSDSDASGICMSGSSCRLKILAWNAETFFDGENDGTEYSEFLKSKKWGREAYAVRLERLCSVIRLLDADVVVIEELEKEGQLVDISNNLCGTFHLSKLYPYGCFATNPGSAIGCAVISRYPLRSLCVHSLDVRTESSVQPVMRPVMEVTVCNGKKTLALFVNHWKSKSGGAAETEVWRNWQESVLACFMQKFVSGGKNAVVACGDFNRDISDFAHPVVAGDNGHAKTNILLRTAAKNSAQNKSSDALPVYSPWYAADGGLIAPGSYWFNGSWERIDHFFAAGLCAITDFVPEGDGPWVDGEGHPAGYKLWSGQGYSDHLPTTATVVF